MLTRAITGAIFVVIVVGATYFSSLSFGTLLLVLVLLGSLEFYKLATKNVPLVILGTMFNLFCFILFFYSGINDVQINLALWTIPGFTIIMIAGLFQKKGEFISSFGSLILGTLYLPISLGLLFLLANSEGSYNPWIPLGIFIIIWMSDTFAYLIGSQFGKHKLLEKISPKKTWEGYVGGIIFSIITAFVLSKYLDSFSGQQWLLLGLIIGVFGTLGDLIESKMKREAGVKDSGTIMPGHGGILDRFDTLFFVAPIVYFIIKSGFIS